MTNIFPIDFEEKLTMAQDDYILFSDSEDGNKIKKAQYKNLKGEKGDTGTAATISVGSTTTGNPGTSASVTNSGTSSAAVLNFTIPKGDKGDTGDTGATGPGATVSVGTTTTGQPGTSASVTNSGTSSAAVFNFTIPKGEKGDTGSTGAAATITAGTTTTLSPGSSATVTNSGTSSAAVFDFGIPQGATGATGNGIASITSSKSGKITTVTITETNTNVDTFQISDGEDGQGSGDVNGPASSVDGDVAIFDGTTGKLIKDGSVALSTLSSAATLASTAIQPGDNISDLNNDSGFITGINSGDVTTALGYTPANSANLGTAAACNTGTSSGNVPILDSNGKLNKTTLPGVALTDTFTVSTSSDLTSLSSAEQGDLAIATTENKTYVLATEPYSTAANRKEILSPTGGVTSVNTQTGAVTLDADDISDSTTTNKFVTASDKTTWNNKQNALATQTAYTTKGTATKVPTITTNTLGQVTAITETNITFPVTSVNGNTGAVTVSEFSPSGTATTGYVLTKTSDGYGWAAASGGYTTATATLTSAGWSSKSQTVSVTGVTASNTVIVSPAPASIGDYANGGVYASAQGSGTLTFSCDEEPSNDITVNVLIMS